MDEDDSEEKLAKLGTIIEKMDENRKIRPTIELDQSEDVINYIHQLSLDLFTKLNILNDVIGQFNDIIEQNTPFLLSEFLIPILVSYINDDITTDIMNYCLKLLVMLSTFKLSQISTFYSNDFINFLYYIHTIQELDINLYFSLINNIIIDSFDLNHFQILLKGELINWIAINYDMDNEIHQQLISIISETIFSNGIFIKSLCSLVPKVIISIGKHSVTACKSLYFLLFFEEIIGLAFQLDISRKLFESFFVSNHSFFIAGFSCVCQLIVIHFDEVFYSQHFIQLIIIHLNGFKKKDFCNLSKFIQCFIAMNHDPMLMIDLIKYLISNCNDFPCQVQKKISNILMFFNSYIINKSTQNNLTSISLLKNSLEILMNNISLFHSNKLEEKLQLLQYYIENFSDIFFETCLNTELIDDLYAIVETNNNQSIVCIAQSLIETINTQRG